MWMNRNRSRARPLYMGAAVLLLVAVAAAAIRNHSTPAGVPQGQQPQGPQDPQPFVPTEKVTADQAVDFPTDM